MDGPPELVGEERKTGDMARQDGEQPDQEVCHHRAPTPTVL